MIDQLRKSFARVVCVDVGVEDIDDGVFADSEHQVVGSLGAAELVSGRVRAFPSRPPINGLAQKPALHQKIRLSLS